MEANDLDIIFEKKFYELSDTEKADMKDLFTTEEEFIQLKFVLGTIHTNVIQEQEKTEVSPKIKENLDHLFHQTYQNRGILWYNSLGAFFISKEKQWHQQNLVRIAAVFTVLLITVPFWNNSLNKSDVQLSQLDKKEIPAKKGEKDTTQDEKPAEEKVTETTIYSVPTVVETLEEKPKAEYWSAAEGDLMKSADFSEDKDLNLKASKNDEPIATVATMAGSTGFINHPDGIFIDKTNAESNSNFSLKNHTDVLDVLTATY